MTIKPLYIILSFSIMFHSLGPLPSAQAQDFTLPPPGAMVPLSPAFNPLLLKGLRIDRDDPFHFEFILDQGSNSLAPVGRAREGVLKKESTKLIKYFLASLTVPEQDLWVNLSPYEKDVLSQKVLARPKWAVTCWQKISSSNN